MDISILTNSIIPVYEQIVSQVCHGIDSGELKVGDPLPPIRQLAKDLSITPATAAKAYQILEQNRIIQTGGRRGTHVHEDARANLSAFRNERLRRRTSDFIREQLRSGISRRILKSVFLDILDSTEGEAL